MVEFVLILMVVIFVNVILGILIKFKLSVFEYSLIFFKIYVGCMVLYIL